MADFIPAFEAMIKNEGGYVLHNIHGDRGGMTFAGIARNMNPKWAGWDIVDAGGTPHADMVRSFYRTNYWNPVRGDEIVHQAIAQTVFDFAVNAGVPVAAKLAQLVAGTTPDGKIGFKSVEALNAYDPEKFVLAYALAKIARYRDIVSRDRIQQKFLLGWINRTLRGVV